MNHRKEERKMKRGKNNKARLGANLLRKVHNAETVIIGSLGQPVRASGKTMHVANNLFVLKTMKRYIYVTKVKRLDPKVIKAMDGILKLIMSEYSYGENVYHEEPTIENALIPEEHKEKLNGSD
jgi:hypothetical protein